MIEQPLIKKARAAFHAALMKSILTVDGNGVPANADKSNTFSVKVAQGIADRLKSETIKDRAAGQTSGQKFEALCADFVRGTFLALNHLRPGDWLVEPISGRDRLTIARYQQYAHPVALARAASADAELAAALGSDYTITPDVVVVRHTVSDDEINQMGNLVDETIARKASLRRINLGAPLLHASISCKWTIRSDRAQNARSEALNLIRNRKGRLPHIVVVTGEPLPSRLASIALGTGDIDCVYHFALNELRETISECGQSESIEMLNIMVDGNRLKDISDLPLDLSV